MHYVTDLHLHSKYSRAVSQNMTFPVMAQYAKQKGIDILTASDWTHPLWFKEIQRNLAKAGDGIYALKSEVNLPKKTLFLLSTEIATIYKQGEKLRRIHNLIFVPNIETAEKVNKELLRRGCNLSADGRPIIGMSSKNLLELILSVDDKSFLIPCHIWTPHFGIYGSASGFDSLEEAFGELAHYIYGIETGLSSDPDMNWQIAELENRSIISTSDAHSPAKMGREATVLEMQNASYENIRQAFIRSGKDKDIINTSKIAYTIEFYPEEGKYHFSGHRNCKTVFGPEEVEKMGNTCPVCKRRLTEGVLYRVQQLSEKNLLGRAEEKKNAQGLKWYTDKMHLQPPYVKLVPLLEIIAEANASTVASQKVQAAYVDICTKLESEFHVLLHASHSDITKIAGEKVAKAIQKVREGDITINPGYDGEFGKVTIWQEEEEQKKEEDTDGTIPQMSLDI